MCLPHEPTPQVRFALSSSAVFSRTDTVTDSEYFYHLVIDLLEDESEVVEVAELLQWWNQWVYSPIDLLTARRCWD